MIVLLVGIHHWARTDNSQFYEEVEQINDEIRQLGYRWRAGVTAVSHYSPEARYRLLGSRRPSLALVERIPPAYQPQITADALDWHNKKGHNWMTGIRDQAQCGSCYVFNAVAMMEAMLKIERNRPDADYDFSEQLLLSCEPSGNCDEGGWTYRVLEYMKEFGTASENCFPYSAKDLACKPCLQYQQEKDQIRIGDWEWVSLDVEDRTAIIHALQKGPVAAFMVVYSDFYYYKGGIYKKVSSAREEGGHGVVIVGYNKSEKFWVCKNSWGQDWGEAGYFRIAFGQVEMGTWVLRAWDITPANLPPVLARPDNQQVKENELLRFNLSAYDDDNDPLTYGCDNLPAGAGMDAVSGQFSWTPSYSQSGTYSLVVTASDGTAKVSTKVQITVINVKKGKKPF